MIKLTLKKLILSVALLSVILTLFSSILAGYRVNQATLVEGTLETNRVYVQKISQMTDNFMERTLQSLAVSSTDISTYFNDEDAAELLTEEANRLMNQSNTFNSVVITSAEGIILATSPQTLAIVGNKINSPGSIQALKEKKPLISNPYVSATNRLIVFISSPIFDQSGTFLGYVGGSIYLLEKNILNELLGEHYYKDGSYVYVVNEEGRLLYHEDKNRINEVVTGNAVIEKIKKGQSGAERVINTKGKDMLAGYGYIPTAKWGIVSQRPTEATLLPSEQLYKKMLLTALPFLLLSLLLIWFISNRIAAPLKQLADHAKDSTENWEMKEMNNVHAWYYEALELQKAMLNNLRFFQNKVNFFIHESSTDPLTGLVNRRSMDAQVHKWIEEEQPFSLIIMDIDRFKRVNDTYGHPVGDLVLKFLSVELKRIARPQDICCRYGGEEFILLTPGLDQHEAVLVAEQLRSKLEHTVSPCGDIITISAGVASYPQCSTHIVELIEIADNSLYEAKNTGRNRVVSADC